LWVFTFFADFEIWGALWGHLILIYKDIQCRWVKSCSRCVKAYNSRIPPPRAILTAARVGRYDHITPIYIPPYAVPPATLIPGSPVSGLTGSQGSRVTGHHGLQGHRVTGLTGSQGHWVIGSITRVFSIARISRVIMVTGSRVTMGHGSPSPWSRVTMVSGHGSPWSQDHPGHRVTHHPGLGSRVTPQPYLPGRHGLGSHTTMVLPRGGVAFGSYQHTIFKIVER
jgi:hypothetical protein